MNKSVQITSARLRHKKPEQIEDHNFYTKGAPVLMPWTCSHQEGRSEIAAYIAANGSWHTIAEISEAKGINPEAMAELITRAVNAYVPTQELIRQLIATLELCMTCDLSWEAENEVDIMLRRIAAM